jgi:hypothetical protein
MSSPYRIPCAPEEEAPEAPHPYLRVLRAERLRARGLAAAVLVGALSLAVAVVGTGSASADARRARHARARMDEALRVSSQRTELARSELARARAKALEAQARFERGLAEARAAGPRSAESATCPTDALGPTKPVLSVAEDHAHGLPSRTVDDALESARRAEIHLDAGRFDTADAYLRALTAESRWGREIVVVATAARPPRLTSERTYEPGEIEGRAYLWDFREGRVLCAAFVHATSSREVDFTYVGAADAKVEAGRTTRLVASLEDDLTRAVERAAHGALRASAAR